MYRKTLTLIAALALVPAAVAAQSGQGEARGQNEAAARGADPDARIQAALRAAAEARIPTSLLESKISEGRAKPLGSARGCNRLPHRRDRMGQTVSPQRRALDRRLRPAATRPLAQPLLTSDDRQDQGGGGDRLQP